MPTLIKRDLERVVADYDEAIALDPQDYDAYSFRGLDYASKDQFDHALADFNSSIELDTWDAMVYSDLGEREDAVADLERALELGLDPYAEQDAEALLEELK